MLSEKNHQTVPEQAAMEKRQNARCGLVMEDQEIQFTLMQNDKTFAINRVRDVSISGVGLEAQQEFSKGEQLSLAYNSGDFQLSINGTVMWCTAQDNNNFALGIKFDMENRQDNALFFLAIRKYLDEFDGTYIDA